MACECFEEGRVTRCGAVVGTLIPSHHEREHYCRTDGKACPTYQLYQLRRTPISQESYYGLWLPPAATPRVEGDATPAPAPLAIAG
jgi:hypothetical protein